MVAGVALWRRRRQLARPVLSPKVSPLGPSGDRRRRTHRLYVGSVVEVVVVVVAIVTAHVAGVCVFKD